MDGLDGRASTSRMDARLVQLVAMTHDCKQGMCFGAYIAHIYAVYLTVRQIQWHNE